MKVIITDGGRAAAGYRGDARDCVTRAIAIATDIPYAEVYAALSEAGGTSAREGVHRTTYERYLQQRGWIFVPTMFIGSGCKVHMRDGELPGGRIIVRLSRHTCAVIDGVAHDTHDPTRGGTRCVYGYFQRRMA